jgi:hypothetical protein
MSHCNSMVYDRREHRAFRGSMKTDSAQVITPGRLRIEQSGIDGPCSGYKTVTAIGESMTMRLFRI